MRTVRCLHLKDKTLAVKFERQNLGVNFEQHKTYAKKIQQHK